MAYEYAELVAQAVESAPPLTSEQVDKLTVLFAQVSGVRELSRAG
ncbi:hypothetical protein [Mycolicibacterium elephantis]|uniref:Uncharacterized protein n=1 Tax=Mycolicibacterium elephantis DSM 44368 TaxID=1335622 RepID=A0A439DYB3_9MYCO|nr:hypothetical protein [Mycolicibacterium elephantis]RWA22559.1 hypothetical protein MELE44368_12350 [Mycolicibacterium elephantis DSM 44368]